MKKTVLGSALALVLALVFAPAPAQAITCAQCGITSGNLSQWLAIDVNGNGTLTTYDLVMLTKFTNYQGCLTFLEDLDDYAAVHTDFDGDGFWDADDQRILWAIEDIFAIKGNPATLNMCDMIDCLRMVILGSCP